jgi:hypothetical protein
VAGFANSVEDILASPTRRGLPRKVAHPASPVADYMKGVDNFCRVMAIRPGDHVVMLTDPLLDPRVTQAVGGWRAGGVRPSSRTWASPRAT